MWKKILPVVLMLLLTGCAARFTRLSPLQQPRNANDLYPVEVAFNSQQQSLRWESIQAYVLVNGEKHLLQPEPLVQRRWEGLIHVPQDAKSVVYRFKFDYKYNSVGTPPKTDSAVSPAYKLTVVDQ